jgi:transposase
MVRWNKTRWRCLEDYCGRSSFTEAIAQVPARARTTRRLRTQIGAAIGDAARSVAEVAAAHGVSWPTAHRAFVTHAEAVLDEPQPTPVLGIDETRRGKPRWERCAETQRWVRVDPWDTGFVDLAGDQGLLGQREGRTGAAVVSWLAERSEQFRAAVQFVAIDPAAVYASAIRTPELLPNATLVVDHFHLVQLANDALTTVRRRVTWDLRDRRGRRIDPEWANRRRLLRARERLSDKSFAEMWNAIVSEDHSGQILSAWIAKEELRTLLSTVRVGGDAHLTRHRLHRFLAWCIDSQIPELLTLASTVDTWWPEINAFVQTGITNVWAPHCTSWDRSGSFGVGRGRGRAVGVTIAQGTDSFGWAGLVGVEQQGAAAIGAAAGQQTVAVPAFDRLCCDAELFGDFVDGEPAFVA